MVVWLVPSTAIAEQTLRQLRDNDHAVAQALSIGIDGFGGLGAVRIVDVAQALRLPPSTYHATSVILVATIQQFRIGDPQGRQVYVASDALSDDGAHTLAEVIARRRPVVIVDEAHNARTPLSFETLARLAPGFVLELSATPARQPWPSNVLVRVDAGALKAEHLLKLPLILSTDPDPERCLADAIACRAELARIAASENDTPLRPLLLIQAEAKRHPGALAPEVVREYLITRCGLVAESIAVATGDQRGLDGVGMMRTSHHNRERQMALPHCSANARALRIDAPVLGHTSALMFRHDTFEPSGHSQYGHGVREEMCERERRSDGIVRDVHRLTRQP